MWSRSRRRLGSNSTASRPANEIRHSSATKDETMSETRTVHDPFHDKDVQVSNRIADRLRGKYAVGPVLPNGEPEFGWRQHQTPPIQHEAAALIERQAEVIRWVEAWVTNPVGAYSVSALDGLFGMTRDKIAALKSGALA